MASKLSADAKISANKENYKLLQHPNVHDEYLNMDKSGDSASHQNNSLFDVDAELQIQPEHAEFGSEQDRKSSGHSSKSEKSSDEDN